MKHGSHNAAEILRDFHPDPGRYVEVIVAKGATIHSCQHCGAVVLHKAIHDAWHTTTDTPWTDPNVQPVVSATDLVAAAAEATGDTVKLTKARLGALAVLRQGPAQTGNATTITATERTIARETADYLIEHHLAWRNHENLIEITEAGHDTLRAQHAIEFA